MNVDAARRVRITVSKSDLLKMIEEKHPNDIHVQSLTRGKSVDIQLGGDSITLTWWSGPMAQMELPLGDTE